MLALNLAREQDDANEDVDDGGGDDDHGVGGGDDHGAGAEVFGPFQGQNPAKMREGCSKIEFLKSCFS